jgi:hypothetical protein
MQFNNFVPHQVTKKRRRTPLMLAETIDAGLLRTAAERKNDERILVQIRGKDCVALEVRYHKVCYCNYTKFLTRERKKRPKDLHQCTRSLIMYSVRK